MFFTFLLNNMVVFNNMQRLLNNKNKLPILYYLFSSINTLCSLLNIIIKSSDFKCCKRVLFAQTIFVKPEAESVAQLHHCLLEIEFLLFLSFCLHKPENRGFLFCY